MLEYYYYNIEREKIFREMLGQPNCGSAKVALTLISEVV